METTSLVKKQIKELDEILYKMYFFNIKIIYNPVKNEINYAWPDKNIKKRFDELLDYKNNLLQKINEVKQ